LHAIEVNIELITLTHALKFASEIVKHLTMY